MVSWWGEELLGRGADRALWAVAGGEVTMARLRDETAWLARVLGYQGIRARSTVAFRGTPSFTQLWALFACWSLGAQVILPGSAVLPDTCAPQFDITFGHPNGQVFVDECGVLVARRRAGRPAGTPHCLVQFSAGTTAVGRTPESIRRELARLRGLDGLPGPGERLLLLDSGWFGLIGGLLRALDVGHPVLFATSRRPAAVLDTAAGAGVIIGTPCQFRALASADGPDALPLLRTAVSHGDVLAPRVGERFAQRFGVRIGQAYGTTETGLVAAELTGRYPSPHLGRPIPGVRTRIVDGVLEVHVGQSPYLDRDDLPHGWLSTHDLVSQDPGTGMLRLRGRTALVSRNTDGAWRNDGEQHDALLTDRVFN